MVHQSDKRRDEQQERNGEREKPRDSGEENRSLTDIIRPLLLRWIGPFDDWLKYEE